MSISTAENKPQGLESFNEIQKVDAQRVFAFLEAYRNDSEDLLQAASRFLVRTAVYSCNTRKEAQLTLTIGCTGKMHRAVHKHCPEVEWKQTSEMWRPRRR